MTKTCVCVLLSVLLLAACAHGPDSDSEPLERAGEAVEAVALEQALDRRTSIWELEVKRTAAGLVIEGKTDRPELLEELRQKLQLRGSAVQIRVAVLPDDAVDVADRTWALVSVPVASVTGKPAFAAALTTQAVMGTPLRVLERQGPFWRVQMPDGYIGWVHGLQIARLTEAELSAWNSADHVVVTARDGVLRDEIGNVLSPLVLGTILRRVKTGSDTVIVRLPDGGTGSISAADVCDAEDFYARWNKRREAGGEEYVSALIETAESLLGVPYLWGGTSEHGVDCSGFISLLYRLSGVIVARDADQQLAQSQQDNLASSMPARGRLLGFGRKDGDGKRVVEHIALSLGQGDFIHSLGSVRIESLSPNSPRFSAYESARYLGAYVLDSELRAVPCASTIGDNGFYQAPPQELQPCRLAP